MKKRILATVAGLTIALSVGWATPVRADNIGQPPGFCKGYELNKERGGSNIIGAQGVSYVATRDASNAITGGTVNFTFVLDGTSCSGVKYQLQVISGVDLTTEIVTPTPYKTGDGSSNKVVLGPITVPSSYSSDCVTLVASTVNASTGVLIDRAPDTSSGDVCDGQGPATKWS